MKRGFILLAVLVLLSTAVLAVTYFNYRDFLRTPMHRGEAGVIVTLPPGSSFSQLVRRLQQIELTDQPFYWRVLGWQWDAGKRIKAGEYRVASGTRPADFLQSVIHGDVVQHSLTIIEGWRFSELRAAIESNPALKPTLQGISGSAIMARLGHADEHPEGWFLPETYAFPRGTTDLELLRRAHQAMHQLVDKVWAGRDEPLPLESAYQALILASIIEKETALPIERQRIAGVFVRRLKLGMRLQTDPTVIYGLGESFDGNLRSADLRRDTPYNTYTRAGLPPTPICLPGAASVHAAVHPAPGDALYFVANGEGGHKFSSSLREHNRAVHRYQIEDQP